MPSTMSEKPMSQLSSRGLRNAPVKNTRNMCTKIATMNTSAAQWCICRNSRPPLTSNAISIVDSKARETVAPWSASYGPL